MAEKKENDSNFSHTNQYIASNKTDNLSNLNKNDNEIKINSDDNSKTETSNKITELNSESKSTEPKKTSIISAKCKKNICIVSLCILAIVIIAAIIIVIAIIKFRKQEDIVIQPRRQENSISRYLEIKNSTNSYFFEGKNENKKVQNYTIITDFIVAINKKNILSNLNKIDYSYESFILIINITESNGTDSVSLGGIDVYDDSKSIDDLINNNEDLFNNISLDDNKQKKENKTTINVPFSKFDFYENGTIEKIIFPSGINEFYKSVIFDLIEKVTPKLSKSLYIDQTNRRRLNQKKEGKFYNYEQIIKNDKLNKTIIYEDYLEKNTNKNEDEDEEGNEVNSKIKRTFDSFGDLILVEMEGEAIFRSNTSKYKKDINLRLNEEEKEKISENNQPFSNLGLDEFKINVTSNMKLNQRTINPLTLSDLNKISQKLNIDTSYPESGFYTKKISESEAIYTNNSYINYIKNKSNENYSDEDDYSDESSEINGIYSHSLYDINDIDNTNNTENLTNKIKIENINYLNSYISKSNTVSLSFLGLNIGLQQSLYINKNTGLRQNYITLIIGNKEYNISNIEMYQFYYSGSQSISKILIDTSIGLLSVNFKYFGLFIKASLKLNFELSHGISIDVINDEMYTKGLASFDLGISGSFGPDFYIISCGVELSGHIAQGDSFIQANTLLKNNSKKTKFLYYKKLSSCRVDLDFYFSISFIIWEKKFKKSINLYKGVSLNSSFSEFV